VTRRGLNVYVGNFDDSQVDFTADYLYVQIYGCLESYRRKRKVEYYSELQGEVAFDTTSTLAAGEWATLWALVLYRGLVWHISSTYTRYVIRQI
jgi:hypothetical protein